MARKPKTGKSVAPSAGYRLRRGRPADAAALSAIERAAFSAPGYAGMQMSERSFLGHLVAGSNPLLVAVQGRGKAEVVCGYALGFVRADSPYVRFVSLAIRPEDAGKGAGKLLFQGIERFARREGYRGVRLEIREDNTRLHDRYLGLGYRIFARVPGYYGDGCAALRMVRDVR